MKNNNNSKLPTLSVGIAAYNEENSLPNLIESLLEQSHEHFIFEYIYIISDGSSDQTAQKISSIKNIKIKFTEHKDRKGKSFRLNELCRKSDSDVLVLLDADIINRDKNLLDKLASEIRHPKVGGVSGAVLPVKPVNTIQRIIYAGTMLWDEVRKKAKNSKLYYSTGAVRALKKTIYKKINFPKIYADDIYPNLFCLSLGFDFEIVSDAIVYYKLPNNYKDFFKQMKRYLSSKGEVSQLFDEKLIGESYPITLNDKLVVLFKNTLKNPFYTLSYLAFLIPVRISFFLDKNKLNKSFWDMASSTK